MYAAFPVLCLHLAAAVRDFTSWELPPEKGADCSNRKLDPDFNKVWEISGWHAGRRTRYWDTSVEYEDCEDHFLYVPRYNDYVALEPHRDPTCDPPLMCAIETNVWPAKVCSKFPANFKEAEAKEVSRQCYQKLCMLARSGKWKNGWGKQKAAKKTPWRARLQAEGHKSIGWHEAFEKECWHGPKVFGDLMPDFDAFVKEHDFNTTKGTFNKKACLYCPTEDECD